MDEEERPEDAARRMARRVIELEQQRDAAVAILREGLKEDEGLARYYEYADWDRIAGQALAALGADDAEAVVSDETLSADREKQIRAYVAAGDRDDPFRSAPYGISVGFDLLAALDEARADVNALAEAAQMAVEEWDRRVQTLGYYRWDRIDAMREVLTSIRERTEAT